MTTSTKANKKMQKIYDSAYDVAITEVKRLAMDILKKHNNLDEFIMAMGMYSFTDKRGNSVDTLKKTYRNGGYRCTDTYAYFKPLNDFMCTWNGIFKMTGDPMRFTAAGVITTDW